MRDLQPRTGSGYRGKAASAAGFLTKDEHTAL